MSTEFAASDCVMSVRNVAVRYAAGGLFSRGKQFEALSDVSFNLYRGESLGVVGRNGAGKSSLLRVLRGIIQPDGGEIIRHTDRISLLSLQVGFDWYLSGHDNAILSGMLLGMKRSAIMKRLPDIEAFSELGEFYHEPLHTYSTGMRARLGFAVAVYLDTDVLLIDEVLAVGDAAFREKSAAAMEECIRSEKTVVMVSHSTHTLRKLCNRAVWIEDGISRMEGDVEPVLAAYQEYKPDKQKAALPA